MYMFSTVKSVTTDRSTGYSTVEVETKYFSYWLGFNSFAGTLAFGQLTVTNSKYEISKMFDFSRRLWVATALHILMYIYRRTNVLWNNCAITGNSQLMLHHAPFCEKFDMLKNG